jgi:phage-related protein
MTQSEWTIEYYITDDGAAPVREFLHRLDDKTYARFLWSFEQLRVRNVTAREPLVKHLEGKLYELREESQTNIYRIVYFFFTGRRIVLLNGFQKKSQKTPRSEISMAMIRMKRFLEREGNER